MSATNLLDVVLDGRLGHYKYERSRKPLSVSTDHTYESESKLDRYNFQEMQLFLP